MMNVDCRFLIRCVTLCLLMGLGGHVYAQQSKVERQKESLSFMHQAEAAKKNGNFAQAEANYRRALARNPENANASYNMGHLYADNKKEIEAMKNLLETAKHAGSKSLKHKAYHNLGNAYMDQKDYQQAVKAYEDALRNDPTDDQTRYNLAVAKEKLEKQQHQNKKKKNKDKDKKNKDKSKNQKNKDQKNKQNKDKENKNKNKQNKQDQKKKQGDKKQQKNKKPQNKKGQKKQKKQKQEGQPKKGQLSKQQAENLLRAARNLEKKVQKKRQEKKAKKAPRQPQEKDW